jgi:hypothetical protein
MRLLKLPTRAGSAGSRCSARAGPSGREGWRKWKRLAAGSERQPLRRAREGDAADKQPIMATRTRRMKDLARQAADDILAFTGWARNPTLAPAR